MIPPTHSFVQVSHGLSVITPYLPAPLFYIHEIVRVTLCNLWVIRILQDVEFLSRSLEPGSILLLNNKTDFTIIPLNKQKYDVRLLSNPINAIITKTRATTVLSTVMIE